MELLKNPCELASDDADDADDADVVVVVAAGADMSVNRSCAFSSRKRTISIFNSFINLSYYIMQCHER